MTPTRSLFRAAALAGVAAFLFSFARVSPAEAQPSTRYVARCTAQAQQGQWGATCTMTVPAGKVFIIESATAHGSISTSQSVHVYLTTTMAGQSTAHTVVAGFPSVSGTTMIWNGAIPGPIFSEGLDWNGRQITFGFTRWGSASNTPWFRIMLSGRLEDL